jgi:iron complex transport system substrate-binding protein
MSYKRVISLLPSATEMMFVLNAENLLVARSHECDFPEQVTSIPVCTSSKIPAEANSAEIDRIVKEKVWNALSLYDINIEMLKELKPDLIITQDQCEVCAIHLNDLENILKDTLGYSPKILSFHPNSLEDMYQNFRELATLLEKTEEAEIIVEDWSDRVEIIKHKIKFVKQKPSIVCIEWMDPIMSAGHWTPELMEFAGAEVLLSNKFKKSEYISIEDLKNANPDGIIIAPCGFGLDKTKLELPSILAQNDWQELKAVQNGHVFIADGNRYFNRSGPSLIDTAEIIAEILQVNQFYYGMEGLSWEQIEKNK